jgi:hypothetical protein
MFSEREVPSATCELPRPKLDLNGRSERLMMYDGDFKANTNNSRKG